MYKKQEDIRGFLIPRFHRTASMEIWPENVSDNGFVSAVSRSIPQESVKNQTKYIG